MIHRLWEPVSCNEASVGRLATALGIAPMTARLLCIRGQGDPESARRFLSPSLTDLLRATFPPGSVTGAPKVRALEVICELEATPREVYTGAIGYRSPVAGLELNVAIRTFEFHRDRVWLTRPRDIYAHVESLAAGVVPGSR